MILTKMQKLCKAGKRIQIRRYGDMDFLTNGQVAAYIGAEAPNWDEEDVAISLGLTEDTRNSYIACLENREQEAIELDNMARVIKLDFSIKQDKQSLRGFAMGDGKVFFVDEKHLNVFDGADVDEYYIGNLNEAAPPSLILAVTGVPIGIIAPQVIDSEDMRIFADYLCKGLELSEREGFFISGQMSIYEG